MRKLIFEDTGWEIVKKSEGEVKYFNIDIKLNT